ncbi:MAG: hypothetical protein ACJ74O_17700 [Frankiaceae bacterium]
MTDERPLLPEQTADDAPEPSYDDRGTGEAREDAGDDAGDDIERLLRERPPHYDGG